MSSRTGPTINARWVGPGELACQAKTSIKALRVYEKAGLLTPDRRESGWRLYGPAHVARLHQILALKALGLSLKQIGETLDRDSPKIGQILDLQARQLASDIRTAKDRLKRVQQARKYLAKHGEVPLDLLLELTRNLAPPRPIDLTEIRAVIENAAREEGAQDTVRAFLNRHPEGEREIMEAQIGDLLDETAIAAAEGDPGSPSASALADRWLALATTLNVPVDDTEEAAALHRVVAHVTADPRLADTLTLMRAAVERRAALLQKG